MAVKNLFTSARFSSDCLDWRGVLSTADVVSDVGVLPVEGVSLAEELQDSKQAVISVKKINCLINNQV